MYEVNDQTKSPSKRSVEEATLKNEINSDDDSFRNDVSMAMEKKTKELCQTTRA